MDGQQAQALARVRTSSAHQRRIERLLFQLPIIATVGIGASVMLVRFILVLKENLDSNPGDYRGVLLLAVIVGTAAFFIVAGCAAIGAAIGIGLRAAFSHRCRRDVFP